MNSLPSKEVYFISKMILCFPLSNSKSFVSFILFFFLINYLSVPGLKFHHLTLVVAFEIFPDQRSNLGPLR